MDLMSEFWDNKMFDFKPLSPLSFGYFMEVGFHRDKRAEIVKDARKLNLPMLVGNYSQAVCHLKEKNGLSGFPTSLYCWLFSENEAITHLLEILLVQEKLAISSWKALVTTTLSMLQCSNLWLYTTDPPNSPPLLFSSLLTTPPIQKV